MTIQRILIALLLSVSLLPLAAEAETTEHDVVIYGGTSAAVTAAVQVARMDRSVVLVSPMEHLGGLTSSGLGRTDTGDTSTIGGLSREFYRRVKDYYDQKKAWDEGSRSSFQYHDDDAETMWRFEPHVAELIYERMLDEAGVTIVRGQKLNRQDGVQMQDGEIVSFTTLAGDTYEAPMFIDATYEGDLMAAAGVSYTVGREDQDKYGEKWAGVHKAARHHRHYFDEPVSPYKEPGNPDSGLVARVHGNDPGEEGEGDDRVQAYCFRMCMTKVEENKVSWQKPENYDASQYELLFRAIENDAVPTDGEEIQLRHLMKIDMMPNRKTDTNNRGPFSTDNIGMNYKYPEASYSKREAIVQEHLTYQQGLMWTLANHPRIPKRIREQASEWGLAEDEFQDNNHWPYKIYVREARRMVGKYVMTQADCLSKRTTPQPIAMGSYTMDSHNVQRFITEEGHVQNEGDIGVHPSKPYQIAYGSIVPKQQDCENLLVPAAMSASHIAYGSIRMEPVFMMLGHAAGTGAVQAIEQDTAVQTIDYPKLREKLEADDMVLTQQQAIPTLIEASSLDGLVLDTDDAETTGHWKLSQSVEPWVGPGYRHDDNNQKGKRSVRYTFDVPEAGRYQVRVTYSPHDNRASNVPVTIDHAGGVSTVKVDQTEPRTVENPFVTLGTYRFEKGEAVVTVSNEGTDGYVIADAVQLRPVEN
jgi:hypothetical protein